ncbi:unnamed protein product [Penicillium nalgiovense]|uniref:Myb-like domain-containing protein n=1 Tax=Penicillium nalgiovense TaxID=60175 RepID=A0A9W4MT27_PENNA|nr:unnamed protein product [Penicillium nalgiovense]CAG7953859.1 unnamed protein product [Penicillium nalgiovense]CAG7955358.1 unnamed protein product [Penicillium nalgiovense]CAG8067815.1 unnamed protein product [Penicillium nalgiovense]CAG8073311.1 unnamed protein product [Penicillium nalgiovense]
MICDNLGPESQYPLGFESGNQGLTCTTIQHSHVGNARSSGLVSECYDATIEAILDDYHFRDIKQTPAKKETSDAVAPSCSSDKSVRGRGIRPNSQRAIKPGRQRSKISKVAVVDNRHMNRTRRSTRANGPVRLTFSTLRDQSSSLPVEERLEFLSWLFEGALSQCLHMPFRSNDVSVSKGISRDEGISTSSAKQSSVVAKVVHGKHTCSSRKGLPWSAKENRLLVQLREEESLAWSEVIKRFDQRFPGRSIGLQVYWSTTLKKQRLS